MKAFFPLVFLQTFCFGQPDNVSEHFIEYPHQITISFDTTEIRHYPFIDLHKNQFKFLSGISPNWELFFTEFDSMINQKDRKLNFYHIGGSHLQADIYTHVVRSQLQNHWENLGGERGQVFPYSLTGTNNPSNYIFKSSNSWKGYRSVVNRPQGIDYGLHGIIASCSDSIINLNFCYSKKREKNPFSAFRIMHNKGTLPYDVTLLNSEVEILEFQTNEELGYTEFVLNSELDSLKLKFQRNGKSRDALLIYGITLMNDRPGISYSSIGVNGASLPTYLKNTHFEEQLCLYPPDFIAFSVGTNDANVPNGQFDSLGYYKNLEQMILTVYRCNPKCAILLTVPNDAFYNKKYPNVNIETMRKMIFSLAGKYNLAVWDFYGLMGGGGTAKTWMQNGLMQSDLVHFTFRGYELKGRLLFDAFLKFLEQMRNTEKLK